MSRAWSMARGATASLLALVLVASCGNPRSEWEYFRAVNDADRLADYDHHEEAIERYREISWDAPDDVDLRYLRYRAARMYEEMGRYDDAIDAYREIWEAPNSIYDDYPARALNRTADILTEHYERPDLAEEIYWGVVRAYPFSNTAEDALHELKRLYRERRPALAELLVGEFVELRETEIGDNLVYEVASIYQEELEDCPAAMSLFDVLIYRYQRSSFIDDVIARKAECYRMMGHVDEEYELLANFVGAREIGILIGDYNYKYYRPAFMRLAEIHRERGELDDAISVFRRFQRTFPMSMEWDDAQYEIIGMLMEMGREDEVRDALKELREEWPESRYIERTEEWLETGVQP